MFNPFKRKEQSTEPNKQGLSKEQWISLSKSDYDYQLSKLSDINTIPFYKTLSDERKKKDERDKHIEDILSLFRNYILDENVEPKNIIDRRIFDTENIEKTKEFISYSNSCDNNIGRFEELVYLSKLKRDTERDIKRYINNQLITVDRDYKNIDENIKILIGDIEKFRFHILEKGNKPSDIDIYSLIGKTLFYYGYCNDIIGGLIQLAELEDYKRNHHSKNNPNVNRNNTTRRNNGNGPRSNGPRNNTTRNGPRNRTRRANL